MTLDMFCVSSPASYLHLQKMVLKIKVTSMGNFKTKFPLYFDFDLLPAGQNILRRLSFFKQVKIKI